METATQQDPLPVLISWPDRAAPIYIRINATLSGNISTDGGMLTVWTPSPSTRFLLKGGYLSVTVETEILISVGSSDTLMLLDGGNKAACLYPIGIYANGDRPDTVITRGVERFDLGAGNLSSAADNILKIGANNNLTSGQFRVIGTLWGDEMAL
jgi:hypothetical protein